jgi:hypothetical protein
MAGACLDDVTAFMEKSLGGALSPRLITWLREMGL